MARSILLYSPVTANSIVDNILLLFRRKIAERCGAAMCADDAAELTVALEIRPGIGSEGFCIEDVGHGDITIAGNDARGLLYGVGKFLRTATLREGELIPGDWRGVSVPEKPVRGIYFASHFHNFYHDAPIEKVERYVEELALWGYNVISVWFDLHHYYGINDPEAQAMLERLRMILRSGQRIGLGASLTTVANEGYADSPEEMRADWTAGHDGYHHPPRGHYHREICPNKAGAPEMAMRWVEERLEAFADIEFEYIWIWPYDQGGCTCTACAPWGATGFLKMAETQARFYRERCPNTKIILSTWHLNFFTEGEWEGLSAAFVQRPEWVDYLMVDEYGDTFPDYPLTYGAPGNLPMMNFPEISMYTCWPWGGFGANPFPRHLQSLWDAARHVLAGGFPYSEGIFEDINKAICAQFYWQEDKPAQETLREYIISEYSPTVVGEVCAAIDILERTLAREQDIIDGEKRFVLANPTGAAEAFALLANADAKLPDSVRTSWRWRILYLRGLIDAELAANEYRSTECSEAAYQELTEIFHVQHGLFIIAPPTRKALASKDVTINI